MFDGMSCSMPGKLDVVILLPAAFEDPVELAFIFKFLRNNGENILIRFWAYNLLGVVQSISLLYG